MNRIWVLLLLFFYVFPANAASSGLLALQQQVWDTEKAFAKTMADRDFKTFAGFLSDE
ncbi:MAG: hypothetical protein JO002_01920, partial [Burkholderiaceae bacterium]|nr:hypothetical protein [Burkholderiaceae bacterium]